MAQGEIHANDTVALQSQILDQAGNVVDLSKAIQVQIVLAPPNGLPFQVTGSFVTNGTDGMVQYITSSADLTKPGMWHMQVYVTMPTGMNHSDISSFKVYPNLM